MKMETWPVGDRSPDVTSISKRDFWGDRNEACSRRTGAGNYVLFI